MTENEHNYGETTQNEQYYYGKTCQIFEKPLSWIWSQLVPEIKCQAD